MSSVLSIDKTLLFRKLSQQTSFIRRSCHATAVRLTSPSLQVAILILKHKMGSWVPLRTRRSCNENSTVGGAGIQMCTCIKTAQDVKLHLLYHHRQLHEWRPDEVSTKTHKLIKHNSVICTYGIFKGVSFRHKNRNDTFVSMETMESSFLQN